MNTIDDLRTSLDAYADRGDARGAAAIVAAATTGPVGGGTGSSHRAPTRAFPVAIVALVAACLLVATLVVVRSVDEQAGVATAPGPDPAEAPLVPIPPITVPFDGPVDTVAAGFGRIWVTTFNSGIGIAEPGALRSFDAVSGEMRSEMRTTGFIVDLGFTDRAVWARVALRGISDPAGSAEPGNHAILRIDPTTNEATRVLDLGNAGPMATSGGRVAAADADRLVILDESGATTAEAPMAEVVGAPAERVLDTETLNALAFAPGDEPDALYAVHYPRGELLELDAATGRHRATRVVGGPVSPSRWMGSWVAPTDDAVWVFRSFDPPIGVARPLGSSGTETDRSLAPVDGAVADLATGVAALVPVGDSLVLALTRFEAVVTDGAGVGPFRTALDPAKSAVAIDHDGRPWIAQWDSSAVGPPVITFVLVDTGEAPTTAPRAAPEAERPGDAPPGSAPGTPPSTMLGDGTPTLSVQATDPLADGESYALIGAGLTPGRAVLAVCPADGQVPKELCWDPLNLARGATVTIEDDGTFAVPWVADRSVYGDRWFDCALVACTLGVVGLDADGQPDVATVLAATPLVFDGIAAPIRPAFTVSPTGPVPVGTTLTVTGSGFPVGATLGLSLCASDAVVTSCVGEPAGWELVVDPDGRIATSTTIRTGGLGSASDVDCTAAPGACRLVVTPWEAATEPFAWVPLDISG